MISKVLFSLTLQEDILPHLRRALDSLHPHHPPARQAVLGLLSPKCWAWPKTRGGGTGQGPGAAETSEGLMGPAFCPDRLGAHRTALLLLLCFRAFLSSCRWLSSAVSSGMVSSDLTSGPEWVIGIGFCCINQN